MVINSAQMQNAGKEFMLFQGLSMKQESQMSKDSFSAIFNNVTGKNNLFQIKPGMTGQESSLFDRKIFAKQNFGEKQINEKNVADKKIFAEKADLTASKKNSEVPGKAIANTEEPDAEDFIEKAASLLVQVTVTVTVVLSVSMDELKEGMQDLGLNTKDLLQADNRYNLFVNLMAEGDAANLLKDNNLVDMLNTMENQIADILVGSGLMNETFEADFNQCFDSIIEKVDDLFEKMMPITGAVANDSDSNSGKADLNGEETIVVDGIENIKLPEVTVSDQSQDAGTDKQNTESSKKEKQQPIKAEDLSNKFVSHLVESFESRFQQVKVAETQFVPDLREIVNQIMEQVKIHVNNANTSIEIQLTPESLGKVQVSVEDNNGILTARFQAESRVAKEAIESNLVQFKEHLAEQGIKVDSVEVSVGNFDLNGHQFGKNQGQEAESHVKKHFSMEDASFTTGQTEDLKEAAYIDNGTSTVSFKA